MFKKVAFEKTTTFKNMRLAEDYDVWLQLGLQGKLANIDCPISYRQRQLSVSWQKKLEMYKAILKIIKTYRREYPRYWLGLLKGWGRIIHFWITQN